MSSENEPLRLIKLGLGEYKRIFDIGGRSAQSQFWPFAIINIGLCQGIGSAWMMYFIGPFDQPPHHPDSSAFKTMALGFLTILVISVLLYFTALIRRIHDSNRSGFWAAPHFILLALGLGFFAEIFSNPVGMSRFFVIAFLNNLAHLAYCLVVLYLAIQPSTEGPNRYGPEPVTG